MSSYLSPKRRPSALKSTLLIFTLGESHEIFWLYRLCPIISHCSYFI
jgi:hypothetical protein